MAQNILKEVCAIFYEKRSVRAALQTIHIGLADNRDKPRVRLVRSWLVFFILSFSVADYRPYHRLLP